MDSRQGIGRDGDLPWKLPADLKHFREVTTSSSTYPNVVIMGRVTWESLPARFRPLPERINVIVSRNPDYPHPEDVHLTTDLTDVPALLKNKGMAYGKIFVIGGQQIYQQALQADLCDRLHVTHIAGDFDCDTFFPDFKDRFELARSGPPQQQNQLDFHFAEYSLQH